MGNAAKLLPPAALAALGAAALYQGLAVRRYTLETPHWKRGVSVRFAVVADLHSCSYGRGQRQLLDLLGSIAPDVILLPGDIVDDRRPAAPAWELLRGAAAIAPAFYTPGNHEACTGRLGRILAGVRRCGVTPLCGRAVRLEGRERPLLLAGLGEHPRDRGIDSFLGRSLERGFSGLDTGGAFSVLLAHRPEYGHLYRRYPFDLTVSGHAHGGQVRIPCLLNGLYAPGQGLFPPVAGGLYHQGAKWHLVSRGLARYRGLPRVWNPPELVVLEVFGS